MLQLQSTGPEYIIKCILQQMVPQEFSLQGSNQSFVAILEITGNPDVITTGKCVCLCVCVGGGVVIDAEEGEVEIDAGEGVVEIDLGV
jgi:hypothetical protein